VSAAQDHDQLDVPPFWTVQAVFDPDGAGGDFAYTIGLSERGLPELHLYARPSLGQDPGADWKFSCRDCCGILNELGHKPPAAPRVAAAGRPGFRPRSTVRADDTAGARARRSDGAR